MSQDEMIALQKAAGLPESWQPHPQAHTFEGRNWRGMLRGRIEIAAAFDKRFIFIQTDCGEMWIEQQILEVNL